MFDSVLDRGAVPQQRFGAGVLFTAAVIAVMVPVVIYAAKRPVKQEKKEADVTFVQAAPPPPPPPLGGGEQPKHTEVKATPVKKPDTIYDTKDEKKPQEKPKEDTAKPAQEGGQAGGVEGGVAGGVVGGTVGGVVGGVIGGTLGGQLGGKVGGGGNTVIPFGAGMNRPSRVAGADPVFTREANEAKVEGLALVKCVITTSGSLTGCSIVKSLPFMDQAILSAVSQWKMTPVVFNGQAVSVSYTIQLRLKTGH